MNPLLSDLPGADLIAKGIAALDHDLLTEERLLVEIARPRLEAAGLIPNAPPLPNAEILLYQKLKESPGDAYPRYNALLRRLTSLEHALDHRLRKTRNL